MTHSNRAKGESTQGARHRGSINHSLLRITPVLARSGGRRPFARIRRYGMPVDDPFAPGKFHSVGLS
jgi:hypothetical protein